MTMDQAASGYLQYLPAIFGEDPFVGRFLLAFEALLTAPDVAGQPGLEEEIGRLARHFDPRTTPEEFLPWLASWVALSVRPTGTPRPSGTSSPRSCSNGQTTLHLRSGNSANQYGSQQVTFGYMDTALYRHAIKTRHNGGARAGNAFDFYVWKYQDKPEALPSVHTMTLDSGNVGIGTTTPGDFRLFVNGPSRLGGTMDYGTTSVVNVAPGTVQFDAPGVYGGRLAIDGATGYVGVGAPAPRTGLDTGNGVLSGAANDSAKAQLTLSGGGTVTWGGPGQRLAWNQRLIAICMERGRSFRDGHFNILVPDRDIPLENVYDGKPRPSARDTGIVLNEWEALYALHPVGGGVNDANTFYVRSYTKEFHAPSNWILVAVVNGDDKTIKLGTGLILAAGTSSTQGSPVPRGTIVMWSGAENAIPGGWKLCDGNPAGVVPDLRNRFVMGAGTGDTAPNRFGEADVHGHSVAVRPPDNWVKPDGNHNHKFPYNWDKIEGYNTDIGLGNKRAALDPFGSPPRSATTEPGGIHQHALPDLGTHNTNNVAGNRPRWYALCFIYKL